MSSVLSQANTQEQCLSNVDNFFNVNFKRGYLINLSQIRMEKAETYLKLLITFLADPEAIPAELKAANEENKAVLNGLTRELQRVHAQKSAVDQALLETIQDLVKKGTLVSKTKNLSSIVDAYSSIFYKAGVTSDFATALRKGTTAELPNYPQFELLHLPSANLRMGEGLSYSTAFKAEDMYKTGITSLRKLKSFCK